MNNKNIWINESKETNGVLSQKEKNTLNHEQTLFNSRAICSINKTEIQAE